MRRNKSERTVWTQRDKKRVHGVKHEGCYVFDDSKGEHFFLSFNIYICRNVHTLALRNMRWLFFLSSLLLLFNNQCGFTSPKKIKIKRVHKHRIIIITLYGRL